MRGEREAVSLRRRTQREAALYAKQTSTTRAKICILNSHEIVLLAASQHFYASSSPLGMKCKKKCASSMRRHADVDRKCETFQASNALTLTTYPAPRDGVQRRTRRWWLERERRTGLNVRENSRELVSRIRSYPTTLVWTRGAVGAVRSIRGSGDHECARGSSK